MSFKRDHFGLPRRIGFRLFRRWMDEVTYSNWMLARWLGEGDVRKPQTFNEKLHWLRIHYRNKLLWAVADKWAVRVYVQERIGERYLNQVYRVWDDPDEVDLSVLPVQYVLKCSHGSGMNILVRDRNVLDGKEAIDKLRAWFAMDYSKLGREWAYAGGRKRIFAERFLVNDKGNIPEDYKIFCFNGVPRMVQVDLDRFGGHTRALYDDSWKRLPVEYLHEAPTYDVPKPVELQEMLQAASELSHGLPFVRVDFYSLPEVVFGEMTFFPGAGTEPFRPADWDRRIGEWLELPDGN